MVANDWVLYKMLSLFSWLLSFVALVHGLHLAEEDGDHAHHGAHEVNEQWRQGHPKSVAEAAVSWPAIDGEKPSKVLLNASKHSNANDQQDDCRRDRMPIKHDINQKLSNTRGAFSQPPINYWEATPQEKHTKQLNYIANVTILHSIIMFGDLNY